MTPDGVGHACSQLTQQRAEKNRSAGAGDAHSPAVSSPTVRGGRCRGARMTTHATPARGARCSVTGNFDDQRMYPAAPTSCRPSGGHRHHSSTNAASAHSPPWPSASGTPLRHSPQSAAHAGIKPCVRLVRHLRAPSPPCFLALSLSARSDHTDAPPLALLHTEIARRAAACEARRANWCNTGGGDWSPGGST